jgi:hypothetical protein
MTSAEAHSLRVSWQSRGNLPCKHFERTLEQSNDGQVTGTLVCAICGAELIGE